MDDVRWEAIPKPYADTACEKILAALKENAVLFAVGRNVDNPQGRAILDQFAKAGHVLANHTWSHKSYHAVEPDWFEQDILKNEALLKTRPNFQKLFRFPALKEGKTAEARDTMRRFLADHGYRNGAVAIDASDWYYDQRLREKLAREPEFEIIRYRRPYLDHLWNRATYYDVMAKMVLGDRFPYTILLHYNMINALYLGDALDMFRKRGWDVVSAEAAFKDPVYAKQPKTAPAGESLVWALAKETGKYDDVLRYPGEDGDYEKAFLDSMGL
jgi:peptidoglycan/xylan/chitin deacetylase (PgdA/CDA1 family)